MLSRNIQSISKENSTVLTQPAQSTRPRFSFIEINLPVASLGTDSVTPSQTWHKTALMKSLSQPLKNLIKHIPDDGPNLVCIVCFPHSYQSCFASNLPNQLSQHSDSADDDDDSDDGKQPKQQQRPTQATSLRDSTQTSCLSVMHKAGISPER